VQRDWVDVLTGLGQRTWLFPVPAGPTSDDLLERLNTWPRLGRDAATGFLVRHHGDALFSSLWGSLMFPTFERFSVRQSGDDALAVEQRIASGFMAVGLVLVVLSYVVALIGVVAAARGTPQGLLGFAAPIFVRAGWFEINREVAAKDFRDFLSSGARLEVQPLESRRRASN
jgi:hypothetical protein